jgi:alkylhydroperoxidase/carboxymuconolactone decarboxylase family protein YurZ
MKKERKMATESGQAKASANQHPVSLWAAALNQLKEWDRAWAEHTVKMTTNPWMDGILPVKFIELVSVGLNASRANLNPEGTRRHIRAAIAAGASRQEILFVLKCASIVSIHSFSFNAPLLVQEASMGSLEDFADLRKKRLERAGKTPRRWKR